MSQTIANLLAAECAEHRSVFEATVAGLQPTFDRVLQMWESSLRQGGKLLLFGNGGSAADAQHIAAELVVRYKSARRALGAIALTTDTSALTACGNDFGFEAIFARQLEALAAPGDVAIGFSTSGRSPNVLAALRQAREKGVPTIGFSGADGGEMPALCDAMILIPSNVTARIQEMHIMIAHALCKAVEVRLGLV